MPDLFCDCFSISPKLDCSICQMNICQYCCNEAQWLIWGANSMSIVQLVLTEEIEDYNKGNEQVFFLCSKKCLDIKIMSFYDID